MLHHRMFSRTPRHAHAALPGNWLSACMALACMALAAGCGSSSSSPVDAAPPDDTLVLLDAGADSGAEVACGGRAGATCKDTEYCDFPTDSCGSNDSQGVCRSRPLLCSPIYEPACGCDGVALGSDCDVRSQGQDISAAGGCDAPEGYFACGGAFCAAGVDYCERIVADVEGTADNYRCLPIPTQCQDNPDCECLAGETCGSECASEQGNPTLTCRPGG